MLTTPKSSREFYNCIIQISERLSKLGCNNAARRLRVTLYDVAFIPGNEVYYEIEKAIKEILGNKFESDVPIEIRDELKFYLDWMDTLDYY